MALSKRITEWAATFRRVHKNDADAYLSYTCPLYHWEGTLLKLLALFGNEAGIHQQEQNHGSLSGRRAFLQAN